MNRFNENEFTRKEEIDMKTIADLQKELKDAKGYLLEVTVYTKDNKLIHSFISDNFPRVDMLRSHHEIEKLLVKDLKDSAIIKSEEND